MKNDADTLALLGLLDIIADWKAGKIRIGELESEVTRMRHQMAGNVVVLERDAGRWSSDHAGTPNPGEGGATPSPATDSEGGVPGAR